VDVDCAGRFSLFRVLSGVLIVKQIAVLYAQKGSIYNEFSECDVWDIARDARNYQGKFPCIAHPPCRAWGRLSHFAKPREDEMHLAEHAVDMVQFFGGVLEHPAGSKLWKHENLPLPGHRDQFGGFTLPIYQSWFGHPAPKNTWLYIVGVEPSHIPAFPLALGLPAGRVELLGRAKREATPRQFASWLIDLAQGANQ